MREIDVLERKVLLQFLVETRTIRGSPACPLLLMTGGMPIHRLFSHSRMTGHAPGFS